MLLGHDRLAAVRANVLDRAMVRRVIMPFRDDENVLRIPTFSPIDLFLPNGGFTLWKNREAHALSVVTWFYSTRTVVTSRLPPEERGETGLRRVILFGLHPKTSFPPWIRISSRGLR